MRLSQWVALPGVHHQTAMRWTREGKMPVSTIRTDTGRWFVLETEPAEQVATGVAVGYVRVSSSDRKTTWNGKRAGSRWLRTSGASPWIAS